MKGSLDFFPACQGPRCQLSATWKPDPGAASTSSLDFQSQLSAFSAAAAVSQDVPRGGRRGLLRSPLSRPSRNDGLGTGPCGVSPAAGIQGERQPFAFELDASLPSFRPGLHKEEEVSSLISGSQRHRGPPRRSSVISSPGLPRARLGGHHPWVL